MGINIQKQAINTFFLLFVYTHFLCVITPDPFEKTTGRFIRNPGYISQYNLISDKVMPFFLSIARIKLALVKPDEYNDLVLSMASIGGPSLGNEKIFTFLSMGKIIFIGEID